MSVDFALILVLATALAGLIWALDAVAFAPRRRAKVAAAAGAASGSKRPVEYKDPVLVEYARSFFPVLLIVLLLRSFIAEPFRIPSGSMMPTLMVGDFILVNKFSYGIRLPVLHTKLLELGQPKRGDVVVFRFPRQPDLDYIKRVVGVPGDNIAYYNKRLYVNGKRVSMQQVGPYSGTAGPSSNGAALEFREDLQGVDHSILITRGKFSVEGEYTVPDGHYFVMGDNRDNSNDGRYWGYVPEDHLVGKAFFIWMNWDWSGGGITWSRIGSQIQ
jgi:signal peptidase I